MTKSHQLLLDLLHKLKRHHLMCQQQWERGEDFISSYDAYMPAFSQEASDYLISTADTFREVETYLVGQRYSAAEDKEWTEYLRMFG